MRRWGTAELLERGCLKSYAVDMTLVMITLITPCSVERVSDVVDIVVFVDRRSCSSLAGEQRFCLASGQGQRADFGEDSGDASTGDSRRTLN